MAEFYSKQWQKWHTNTNLYVLPDTVLWKQSEKIIFRRQTLLGTVGRAIGLELFGGFGPTMPFFCGATSTDDYRLLVEHNFLVSQLLRRCRRNIFCSLSIFIDWLRLCVRFFNTFFVSRNISIYNFPSKSMVYLTNRHLYSFVLIKLIQIQKCSTHEIHIFCGSVHLTIETHCQPWMKTCRCILCMEWRVR